MHSEAIPTLGKLARLLPFLFSVKKYEKNKTKKTIVSSQFFTLLLFVRLANPVPRRKVRGSGGGRSEEVTEEASEGGTQVT